MDSLSDKNPLVKQIRRAVARGTLTEDGYAVAEGFHLVAEALASKREIGAVIVSEAAREIPGLPQTRVVSEKTFRDLSSTESPQGVIALVRPPAWTLDQILSGCALVVVLDGVQDPGNAGAILRSAEAFGATGALKHDANRAYFQSAPWRCPTGKFQHNRYRRFSPTERDLE